MVAAFDVTTGLSSSCSSSGHALAVELGGAVSSWSQAARAARSSLRARLTASQPSLQGNSRQEPPSDSGPLRDSCAQAARSPSKAAPFSSSRQPGASARRAAAAPSAHSASGPGANCGAPSARPVSCMAPDRAQARAGCCAGPRSPAHNGTRAGSRPQSASRPLAVPPLVTTAMIGAAPLLRQPGPSCLLCRLVRSRAPGQLNGGDSRWLQYSTTPGICRRR